MDNFTREEMASFRMALALVVVKNRHQQKQKKLLQEERKRGDASNKYQTPVVKKLRTMDSLIFPWTDRHDKAQADNPPHDCSSVTPARLEHAQSKQREHLQSIMATALQTASCLVPAIVVVEQQTSNKGNQNPTSNADTLAVVPPVAQQQQQQAAWSTLEALTRHMAQQVSFAMQVATHANKTKKENSSTTTTRPVEHWIAEWVRDNLLQQLLLQPIDTSQQSMDAAFLVWHGILFGGFGSSASSSCPVASKEEPSNCSRAGNPTCYAAFRSLFLRIVCDWMRELGIVWDLPGLSASSSPPSSSSSSSSSSKSKGPLLEQPEEESCKTISDEGGTVDSELFHRNAKIPLNLTNDNARKPARKKADWLRLFEMKPNHHQGAGRFKNRGGGGNHEALVDQWLVHCLQLLQKLARADKDDRSSMSNGPMLSHPLHPESFLPPTDLVAWYLETATADILGTVPRPNKSATMEPTTHIGVTHPQVDPGAKLMTMVALYQALMLGE
jgi:hypothetical protein